MSAKGLFTISDFPVILQEDCAAILAPAEQFEN